jgi:DNA-binding transcriptional LysR family regulator
VAAETLLRTASGASDVVGGVVRVTASDVVACEVLPAILTDFRAAWPAVDIELAPSNRLQDLLHRDADIAVRMARPTQNALFARRIGAVHLSMFAHRRYLERHGEPRSMADLRRHTVIGYDRSTPAIDALADLGFPVDPALFGLRTDHDPAQVAFLRAGYGVGVCQRPIALRDPDLVPILADVFGFDLDLWVVMHEDLKSDRRMRLLFDHLATGIKAYLDADR